MRVVNIVVPCTMLFVASLGGCQRTQAGDPKSTVQQKDGQTYEIVLDRPSEDRVGTSFEMLCEGISEKIERFVDADGMPLKPVKKQSAEIKLKAVKTRLGKDSSGALNKASLTLQTCRYRIDGGPWQELKSGTVLLTEPGNGPAWRLYAETDPLPDGFLERFSDFLATRNRSNDKAFGIAGRKKVGDRWPMAIEHLSNPNVPGAFKGVSDKDWLEGWVTLVGIEEVAGRPCMRVDWTFSNKKDAQSIVKLPGLEVVDLKVRSSSSWVYPLDVKIGRIRDRDDLEFCVALRATSGVGIGTVVHASRTATCKREYRELSQ